MKKSITLLLFTVLTISMAWSQSADDIIKKYFESAGGLDKWKALKTVKMTGTVPTPQGEFAFELNRKAPNKYMISVDVMGQKLIPQAFDGEVAWTINPFMGDPAPQKLPEDQAKAVKIEAEFEDPFIDYAKKGYEVTYEGTGDVDGISCSIVKLIKNKGKADEEVVMNFYFDGTTNLPLMVKQKSSSGQMAGQEMDIYFSDYQDAGDGLMMPFTIDTKVGGQSVQAVKFTAIALNQEIADELFAFPVQ